MEAKNRLKIVLAEKNARSNLLADKIGVTKTTVSRWVNNVQQPSLNKLYEIAEYLEVDVRELLVSNMEIKEDE